MEQKSRPAKKSKSGTALRAHALGMLARREYSRPELASRLAIHAEDPAEIPGLLDDFESRGWLSEQRAAEQLIASRRGRYGSRRIAQDLRDRGISEDAIAAALGPVQAADRAAALAVWRRKFGQLPQNPAERARQARFLQGRGFALDVVLRIVGGKEDDDSTAC